MSVKSALELASGVLLIVLGILFVIYIEANLSNIASDAIFIGAGVLMFRKGFKDRKIAQTSIGKIALEKKDPLLSKKPQQQQRAVEGRKEDVRQKQNSDPRNPPPRRRKGR